MAPSAREPCHAGWIYKGIPPSNPHPSRWENLSGEAIIMFGQRPTAPREADHRDPSLRSVLPLVAAAALFIFGLAGLLTVLPYSSGASPAAVFVTSPSQSPQPSRDEAQVQEVATPSPKVSESVQDATQAPGTVEPTATEAPPAQAPRIIAASVPQAPVAGLTPIPDPPTPTPTPEPSTPEPTPTATPTEAPRTATPTPSPTATPTPLPEFIPDPRERGPVNPQEPVTAFIDTTFQQPAPEAPNIGGVDNQFPVTP